MHPEIARQVIAQYHHDLYELARGGSRRRGAAPDRRAAAPDRRGLAAVPGGRAIGRRQAVPQIPYWRITWTRVAAPASGTGGRAWLIIISARSTRRMAGAR